MEIFAIVILAFAVLILAIIWAIFSLIITEINKAKLNKYIDNIPDFIFSHKFIGEDAKSAIAIDETRKALILLSKTSNNILKESFEFEKIISAEIFEDGDSISTIEADRGSQLSGIAIGGIIGGSVGAAIGGLSGKRTSKQTIKIKNLDLRITVNDFKNPLRVIKFLNIETEKNSDVYKKAAQELNKWMSIFKIICKEIEVS